MKISPQDATLFFDLMISLHLYINQRLHLLKNVQNKENYRALSIENRNILRHALYENISLIDDYVKANPDHFSEDNLAIVLGWKTFIGGDFFIERLLKKHAIFIQETKVYGVLALFDSFEEMLGNSGFPYCVKTILLPFKGKIVYDGILEGYNVYFGSGISHSMKEAYLIAKQNGRIIESFDQPEGVGKPKMQIMKDWRPEVNELIARANKLRASQDDPILIGQTFGLTKAVLELTQITVDQPDNLDEIQRMLKKVYRALRKIETTLERAEF